MMKEFVSQIESRLKTEIGLLMANLDKSVVSEIRPRLEEITKTSTLIAMAALAGKDVDDELVHLNAQLANIAAEKIVKTKEMVRVAIQQFLAHTMIAVGGKLV